MLNGTATGDDPTPVEVNRLIALFKAGHHIELEKRARLLAEQYPNCGFVWMILGASLQTQGKNGLPALQQAVELAPEDAKTHCHLGIALQAQGRLDDAVLSYRRALQLNPDYADAHYSLGVALQSLGQLDKAAASYRHALQVKPDYLAAEINLGNALKGLGQIEEAVASYRRALQIKPDYAEVHYNLGLALQALGQADGAASNARRVLQIRPDFTDAHVSLGNALKDLGQLDGAIASYRRALQIKPDYAEVHSVLGNALKDLGYLEDALASYRRALQIKPDYAEAHSNLGMIQQDLGQLEDAVASHRRALQHRRDRAELHSNLLFALNYHPNMSAEELFAAALDYEATIGAPLRPAWQGHDNVRGSGRRLKIGYVSPDFRRHAVAFFLEPIFANHDRRRVEIYGYAQVRAEDDYTSRFRRMADRWQSCIGLSDETMARLIREDQIDILVDLAGHTANNRLPVFARKPAPIQATYLGYPGTTGLAAMDYRITDEYADPAGSEACYSETLLRLPHSLWCYQAPPDMPDITPLPAASRGYVTYGSFNNVNKLDQGTIALWASLLRDQQTARLMLITVPEGDARQRLVRAFAERGIDAARLILHGKLPSAEFRRKMLDTDIALDPLTVNGATTTCESMWLGVPVISLAGKRFLSRAGSSFHGAIGTADLVASTAGEYLQIAARLANDLPRLAERRRGLRGQMAASPLCDARAFTQSLERAYFQMFERWLNGAN